MTRQYCSRAMASVYETAEGLHHAGLLDKQTMRQFDEACLTPVRPLTPEQIRALRERERGEKRPQGPSLKLLSLVAKKGLATVA